MALAKGTISPAVPQNPQTPRRLIGRLLLGAVLLFAGISHLTTARADFQAQVPTWIPVDPDLVVIMSGRVEIALGAALLAAPRGFQCAIVAIVAAFFVAVFPGNISQLVTHTDAFGLDSDAARAIRLVFQPVLVLWALWSTSAWHTWRSRRGSTCAEWQRRRTALSSLPQARIQIVSVGTVTIAVQRRLTLCTRVTTARSSRTPECALDPDPVPLPAPGVGNGGFDLLRSISGRATITSTRRNRCSTCCVRTRRSVGSTC